MYRRPGDVAQERQRVLAVRSNASTERPSGKWKSVSSRARKVLHTRERGDATMVTELRNDIRSPDAARGSAQLAKTR